MRTPSTERADAAPVATTPSDIDSEEPARNPDSRLHRLGLPCALFLLALGVRALPFESVFQEDGLQLFGHDAYYHMRRIAYSVARFPNVLDFDPYINFPEGARAIWPPLFDWTLAALLIPLRGLVAWHQLERAIAWIPPVLGSATVVILYRLARRSFGTPIATLAGLYLALLSGHFWYSQLGFVDHHAAVAPLVTGILAAGMSFFRRPASLADEPRRTAWAGLMMGLAMGGSLILWPGTLLHVGLLEIALLVHLLTRPGQQETCAVARAMAFAHGTALCVVAPFTFGQQWNQWSPFSPVVLSYFQFWYFVAATIFSLACGGAWRRGQSLGATPTRRATSALGIGILLIGASLALFPSMLLGVEEGWQWFAREERFQSLVNESSPLFVHDGRFTTGIALLRLSGFVFVAPLVIIAFAWSTLRSPRREDWVATLFLLWWTAGLLIATIAQKRFFNSSSPPLALLYALATCWAFRTVPRLPVLSRMPPALGRSLVVCGAIALMIPTLRAYQHDLGNLITERGANQLASMRAEMVRKKEMLHLARWIRSQTPDTSGWHDTERDPEYGILAPWEIGHILEYEARRPTLTNNFGDDIGRRNFDLAQSYFVGGETEALALVDGLRIRYVVVPSNAGFLAEKPGPGSMFASLHQFDGSAFRVADANGRKWVPALERHRLIHEWVARAANPRAQFRFKLYEIVRGAQIVGRADPGTEIRARLRFETDGGRGAVYAARTVASSESHYTLRVPYASDAAKTRTGDASSVRAMNPYELLCDGDRQTVRVSEEAVTQGEPVLAPDLCFSGRQSPAAD